MSVAVVTITCPKCGGDVKNVEVTGSAQKIPCTYCGTDLHLPQIGARQEDATLRRDDAAPQSGRAEAAPGAMVVTSVVTLLVVALGLAFAFAFASGGDSSEDPLAESQRREAAQSKCEDACRSACQGAPRPAGRSPEVEASMRRADQTVCETKCRSERNCWDPGSARPR
ncbi:MAG: hypothetical protein IPK80_34340 [Nannocystis sp.]|nr:hypothetical protein [Nannocystis sp.]